MKDLFAFLDSFMHVLRPVQSLVNRNSKILADIFRYRENLGCERPSAFIFYIIATTSLKVCFKR